MRAIELLSSGRYYGFTGQNMLEISLHACWLVLKLLCGFLLCVNGYLSLLQCGRKYESLLILKVLLLHISSPTDIVDDNSTSPCITRYYV